MGFRNVISDGSTNPPHLRTQINLSSMCRLPGEGDEWTLAQRLDQVVSAGFQGIAAQIQTPLEADELAALLQERNLPLGLCAIAADADDLLPQIDLAHRTRAQYLSVRVPGSLRASPDIAEILKDMYDLSNDSGLPLLIQTHRGSVTQDLRRTIKVLNRYKKLRLSADFSQYALAADLTGPWTQDIMDAFEQISNRAAAFEGRISYGNQIQDDIAAGKGEFAQQYKKLWQIAFSGWLERSTPGDILPFTVNLGPHDADPDTFDRWAQSQTIRRLADEAWSAAHAPDQTEPVGTATTAAEL
jgi:sugar phosphate isomerase/epimerase